VGLHRPALGTIRLGGTSFWDADPQGQQALQRRFGIMYQQGALWTSMTLAENVALPLQTYSRLSAEGIAELVDYKLSLVGLGGFGDYYPAEISGGMRKRAAIARAMALDPGILFLDEPSAGLDPITSAELDDTILLLRDTLGITFVVVTHELASIYKIADRVIMLDKETKGIVATGSPEFLRDHCEIEWVRRFFRRETGTEAA
jgi:phospholipid/cholesterol/gamma-HCH transport system ATP-binding protein